MGISPGVFMDCIPKYLSRLYGVDVPVIRLKNFYQFVSNKATDIWSKRFSELRFEEVLYSRF